MTFFPDPATIVSVGGIDIRWYAVTLVAGCVIGFLFASDLMKSHGYRQTTTDDLLVVVIVGMLLGGRIGWVIQNYHQYRLYLWNILSFFDGGIDYLMGMLVSCVGILWYTRKHHMSFRRTADVLVPALLLAIMVAKIGRGLEYSKTFAVVGLDVLTFVIVFYVLRPYKPGHQRGDSTAITFLMMGMIQVAAMVLKLDKLASNMLISSIIAECFGIWLYVHNRHNIAAKPIILFDFDGTIMDSEGMVLGIFAYLFQKFRTIEEFTKDKQEEIFSVQLQDALRDFFPDIAPEIILKEYRNFQKSLPGKHLVQMLPHTEETLRALSEQGYVLGIVTSRLSESCEMWLEDLEIEEYITFVTGTERYRHAKPAPDGIIRACEMMNTGHDSVIYVGDRPKDVKSGKNAGVYAVGLLSNEELREEMEAEKPNAFISDISELLDIVKEDHAWSSELI